MNVERLERWIFGLVAGVVVAAYGYRLGELPSGLFVDETSVGYNAQALLRTGADQYGETLPLFFRSFGDYKSPIHVYAVAGSVALFGPTAFAVRLPPCLFAFATAVIFFLFIRSLTGRPILARWLAVALLLAPPFFVYGRHAVSEASTLPFFLVLALWALLAFERNPRWRSALAAGAAFGIYTYTYTTARLLAPLLVGAAAATFFPIGALRRKMPAFLLGAAIMAVPLALYIIAHPGALDARFRHLWIFWDHPSFGVALGRFTQHYAEHLSFDFLFRTGDPNPRHNLGQGLLPMWTLVPLLFGLIALYRRRRSGFGRFLAVSLLLAPIPVALCQFELPHGTRMFHFVPIAFTVIALAMVDWLDSARPARGLIAVGLAAMCLESALFVRHYFVDYPAISERFFDGGVGRALRVAFSARNGDAPLFVPKSFFDTSGTYLEFWGGLDPARRRTENWPAFGIWAAGSLPSYPSGALVILSANEKSTQAADSIGTVTSLRDGKVIFSIVRIR